MDDSKEMSLFVAKSPQKMFLWKLNEHLQIFLSKYQIIDPDIWCPGSIAPWQIFPSTLHKNEDISFSLKYLCLSHGFLVFKGQLVFYAWFKDIYFSSSFRKSFCCCLRPFELYRDFIFKIKENKFSKIWLNFVK